MTANPPGAQAALTHISSTRVRKERAKGRSAYQVELRQQTRAAILSGAARVFSQTPYVHATIDDLIRAANISRATFYQHFQSKLALAIEIYDGIGPNWRSHYEKLCDPQVRRPEGLRLWLDQLVHMYTVHGYISGLVLQLEVYEPSFRARLHADRAGLIHHLGALKVPGFAEAQGDSPEAQLQFAKATLLLRTIAQVCTDASNHRDMLGPDLTELELRAATEDLAFFLKC